MSTYPRGSAVPYRARGAVLLSAVSSGDLRGIVGRIKEIVDTRVEMPAGYHVEYGGQFESEQEASRILTLASLFSLLVIFLILYQEFKNLRLAGGLIMLNMPFALLGGVLAIRMTSGNNKHSGDNRLHIAVRHSHAQRDIARIAVQPSDKRRRKPVPGRGTRFDGPSEPDTDDGAYFGPGGDTFVAVGGDLPGNEIQSPMAKVILGGLLTSTLLNAFIIPVFYIMINRKKHGNA